ncbi:MAG: hypothetical protein HYZ44_02415 [Bacteroidetes bacterium]|nr:hypothetical protein [Bacteroidota bacterium]
MLRIISKIGFISILLIGSTNLFAQNCTVSSFNTICVGQPAVFYTNCGLGQTHQWTAHTSGGQLIGTSSDGVFTFLTSGSYKISYSYSQTDCQMVWQPDSQTYDEECTDTNGSGFAFFTVNPAPIQPIVSSSNSSICTPTTILLTVTNPQSGVTYTWSSNPTSQSYSGTSATFTDVASTTLFTVVASNGQCTSSTVTQVLLLQTLVSPSVSSTTDYRKAILTTSQPVYASHYWQNSPNGTDFNNPVTTNPYTVSQNGSFYIRAYLDGCWTNASAPANVQLNTTPPIPSIVQVPKYGFTIAQLSNKNNDWILQNADYFWVSDAGASPTVVKKYNENTSLTGSVFFQEGTYFLRGKDKTTGIWGNTGSFIITLADWDNTLNWVHTKTFDGTSDTNPVSESKSFFDQRGQALQSQSKSFHQGQPVVFASLSLKDKYDRTVGGTLSAPILQNNFKYNSGFAITTEGKPLTYTDFEKPTPTELATDQKGTLGNYYSLNNKWSETKVPTALRLYSRTDFYEDGTGEERRAAQPGDTHFIGSGKEVLKGTFPVGNSDANNELSDYLDKRAIALGVPDLPKIEGVQNVVRDENERYVVSISDKSGKVLMTARKGSSSTTNYDFPSSITSDKMAYFYVLGTVGSTSQTVTITGTSDYILENTITNTPVTKLTTALPHVYTLAAGFYRVLPATGTVTVSYTHSFTDIAYQFYNDAGRLVVSVSPNGYEQWRRSTPVPFSDIDKSTHTYNHQGWLLSMTEKDAGTTNYLYRKDGKIRFSQNAQQKFNETQTPGPLVAKGRFSYTNYDDLGRPVESGEYIGTILTYATLNPNVQTDYPLADKKDWVRTNYDYAASPAPVDGYTQGYVRGAVSWTENANTKTWYSYDEMGRVVWMAQKPTITNFPYTFVTNYEYDFVGNVLKTYTRARTGGLTPTWQDAFYHHYEYDPNKRLQKVYTSKDGIKTTLQAEYIYYLHGPLKRVVLASNLQGIDFVYNIHGWLTQINHPDTSKDPGNDGTNGIRKDVFGLILEYYERSIVPETALVDPTQYHHLPKIEGETQQLLTTQADPFSMYRKQLHTNIEQLKQWSGEQKNFMQSGGGN